MGDRHTRVTYRRNPGFLERVGNSCVGMLVGIALLLVSSALLFWNEGRAVKTAKSLDEGLSLVLPIQNAFAINNENNQKLVHLIGDLHTEKALKDDLYGIHVNAVKLRRKVEMYQWVEHQSTTEYNEGGQTRKETTYSYDKEWKTELINSGSFDNTVGHHNPSSFPVEGFTFQANPVHVGIFELSNGLIDWISEFHPIPPSLLPEPTSHSTKLVNGKYYSSQEPRYPQVGDIRVSFEYAGLSGQSVVGNPDKVSIVARQSGNKLTAYRSQYGQDIEFLYFGELSAEAIFSKEQQKNTMMTWAVRFGGWLLMFIGFGCLTSIVTTLVDWLPIVRELVAAGVHIMNLAFSISLSLTVIAIGWITYRPLLGLTILAMAATPFIMTKFRSSQRSSSNRYD